MKKIITLTFVLLTLSACYVPTGNYRVTLLPGRARMADAECTQMTVEGNALTCQKEKQE